MDIKNVFNCNVIFFSLETDRDLSRCYDFFIMNVSIVLSLIKLLPCSEDELLRMNSISLKKPKV